MLMCLIQSSIGVIVSYRLIKTSKCYNIHSVVFRNWVPAIYVIGHCCLHKEIQNKNEHGT